MEQISSEQIGNTERCMISSKNRRLKVKFSISVPPKTSSGSSFPNGFGGLWDAAVKSMKLHFRRVIGETYEELITVLSQIESCLNSRPLTPLPRPNKEDSDGIEALTPGHFRNRTTA